MKKYEIKFVTTKKYDPKIERTVTIETDNALSCRSVFNKSFKEVKVLNVNLVAEDGNVSEKDAQDVSAVFQTQTE